ncbi:polyprenyl synthetase family protein [Streptomyces djakartensis]|uniref:polyprenyl synthetase family protein n=1 Tax=Streptomyces djakartensis TaxID=68193 RepID=UPI0034DEF036
MFSKITEAQNEALREVENRIREEVEKLPPHVRLIAGYHLGWWDYDGQPVKHQSGGKRVRALFTILSKRMVRSTGEVPLEAAVAVELVHEFSLLHDDVFDNDISRRGRPSAWSVFGMPDAVLAGNALLTLALDIVPRGAAAEALSAAVQLLLEGQANDCAFTKRSDITVDECREMAKMKTGALLGAACSLGGLAGQASSNHLALLREFGERVGLAWQLVNDLHDIWPPSMPTGKPERSDLASRKRTLPIVAALCADQSEAAADLRRIYNSPQPTSTALLETASQLVEAAGGRSWALVERDRELSRAREILDLISPQDQTADISVWDLTLLITRLH